MTTPEIHPTTVDGLIEVLTKIKKACGGNTYIQVNDMKNGCTTGLMSVCLDNNEGNSEALVYIETDSDEYIYPHTFEFYTQGKEI